MLIERAGWSGDGDFTRQVLDVLQEVARIEVLRVEDAPATRSEADYLFLSNEIYVRFATVGRWTMSRVAGLPWPRRIDRPIFSLAELDSLLAGRPEVGPADYADAGMLQYLRTERIVAPYQTRGIKLVELLRIYRL